MPFSIKVGGKTREATPYIPPEEEEATELRLSHAGYLAWDNYLTLSDSRTRAITLWERHESLGEQMDQRGPDHPRYTPALNMMGDLEGRIVVEQVRFLQAEQRADACWKQLRPEEREAEGLTEFFRIKPTARHILGLWRQKLPVAPLPDFDFEMLSTAFLIATPEQKQVYLNLRFGKGGDRV